MNKSLHIILFLLLALSGHTRITYTYDASGNRITRRQEIIIRQKTPASQERTMKKDSTPSGTDNPLVKIQAHVKDNTITIHILNTDDFSNAKAQLYSTDGVPARTVALTSALTTMDVSTVRNGIYILNITAGDATSQWKIILK